MIKLLQKFLVIALIISFSLILVSNSFAYINIDSRSGSAATKESQDISKANAIMGTFTPSVGTVRTKTKR